MLPRWLRCGAALRSCRRGGKGRPCSRVWRLDGPRDLWPGSDCGRCKAGAPSGCLCMHGCEAARRQGNKALHDQMGERLTRCGSRQHTLAAPAAAALTMTPTQTVTSTQTIRVPSTRCHKGRCRSAP